VQNRFLQLGPELMERGVTVAMLEGTWLDVVAAAGLCAALSEVRFRVFGS
jgi:hypothetical protein